LIELCDLPPQPHLGEDLTLDGHSLAPFLTDPEVDGWQGPTVALIGIRDTFMDPPDGPPHFSVCSRQYRYTLCGNGEEELYDHAEDPHEWTNLAGSPAHGQTKEQLRQELMSLLEKSKVPDDYRPNQP
jgi:iduronate 2-sulfatase